MARRIRWQIVIAAVSSLLIAALLGWLALSTTSVSRPLAGGVYVEGVIGAAPSQLNPLADDPQRNPIGADVAALMFEGLMRIGPGGLPERALAQEWSVDETGQAYTFSLRPGLQWQDGVPITADDVIFTIRAVQNREFPGDPQVANLWRNVLVDKLDDLTVRYTLNAPYAPFLSAARLPILPAHLLNNTSPAQWASAPFGSKPVGSGPYRLESLDAERVVLAASPTYYGIPPLIARVELRFFTDTDAAISALEREEILGLAYDPLIAARAVALPPTAHASTLTLDGYTTLTFNLREGPLASAPVRQALARALDKTALVDRATGGQARRIDTPILPGWWAFDPSVKWYNYSPETAARDLGELGYAPGSDGVFTKGDERLAFPLITDGAPDHLAAAAEIARQWGAIGVQITVQQLDGDVLRARLRAHEFVMAVHSFSRLGPDPDPFELWYSDQAASGLNYAGLQDDALDALIASARSEPEPSLRGDDYSGFQDRWIALAPAIILYQPTLVVAAAPRVGGQGFDIPEDPTSALLIGPADRFRRIGTWFVNSSREINGDLRQDPVAP